MAPVSWLIANLLLLLPAEYKLISKTAEEVSMGTIPGASAHLEFRGWEAPRGRALHAAYWRPRPARDGGPMHAVAEWPVTVAGQTVKVYETDYFMGRKQRVLVTYLHFTAPEAQLMLYATGLSQGEFMTLLAQAQMRP